MKRLLRQALLMFMRWYEGFLDAIFMASDDDDKIRQAWLEAKADLAKTAKEIEEGEG